MEEESVTAIRETSRNLLKLNRRFHRDEEADNRRNVANISITPQTIEEIADRLKTKSPISVAELQTLKNGFMEEPKCTESVLNTHGALRGLVRELTGTITLEEDKEGKLKGTDELLISPQPQLSGSGQGDVRVQTTMLPVRSAGNVNPKPATTQPKGSDEAGISKLTRSQRRRLKRLRQEARLATNAQASEPAKEMTNVPRGKNKRKNTDADDKAQQPPAKRPFLENEGPRSSAKEQSDLTLMIFREDGEPVDEAFAAVIRKKLRDMLVAGVAAGVKGECMSFATSGLVSEGFFLLTPMTTEAREWMLTQNFGEHNGVSIGIRGLYKARASIWVPGKREDHFDDIMKMIGAQNSHRPELRTKEWVLLSRTAPPLGEKLVVGLPLGVLDEKKERVWISLEATQVLVRLIIPRNNTRQDTEGAVEEVANAGSDVRKQCAAAGCFCNLGLADSKAGVVVAKAAGTYLATALDSLTTELAVTCAWAVGNLAGSGPTASKLLVAQGALSKLCDLLLSTNDDLKDAATYALVHFAYQMRDELSAEHLQKITEALSKSDISISSSQLLFILSCHNNFPVNELSENYLQKLLLDLPISLQSHFSLCHSNCSKECKLLHEIRILANIRVNDKIYNVFIEAFIRIIEGFKMLLLKADVISRSVFWLLGNLYNFNSDHVFFDELLR